MDEGYSIYYTEKVDLCWRVAEPGREAWWVAGASVVHFEGRSTGQVAEAMCVQLWRSKVQFHRKCGLRRRAQRSRRLVWPSYWPRLAVATVGLWLSTRLAARARVCSRVLAELPKM